MDSWHRGTVAASLCTKIPAWPISSGGDVALYQPRFGHNPYTGAPELRSGGYSDYLARLDRNLITSLEVSDEEAHPGALLGAHVGSSKSVFG